MNCQLVRLPKNSFYYEQISSGLCKYLSKKNESLEKILLRGKSLNFQFVEVPPLWSTYPTAVSAYQAQALVFYVLITHHSQFAEPNALITNVYDKDLTPWPLNTILITGNSMINGIDKRGSRKKNSNVKVRYFNGALVEDMFYKWMVWMTKKPTALLLHVDTNNTVSVHQTLSWRNNAIMLYCYNAIML